jgi:hypothetical protein
MYSIIEIYNERLLTKEDFIALVRARAKYKCERCNRTEEELGLISYKRNGKTLLRSALQSHHKDGNRENNILKNGECLCATCHNKEHEEKKNAGLRKRNSDGQASRAGLKGWEKINSMPEEERRQWLSDRANKIWEARRSKEVGA